jgi:hypothetical protein
MNDILTYIIGEEYEDYIKYKDLFKILNEILDTILYLCNNVSNDRLKQYIINTIEYEEYYEDLGEGNLIIDDNAIFEKITNGKEYKKMLNYIDNNLININKIYNEFYVKYKNIDNYNDDKYKDPKYDLVKQKIYISEKLEIIVNGLDILKIEDSKEVEIKFNIILISKDSFIDYKFFKNFFKNLHIIDNSTPGYDKDSNIFIEKLLNIYNLIFKDVLKKFNDYNIKIDKLILDINNLVDELKEKELKEKELIE